MSVLATMTYHLEGPPLHVHMSPLAHAVHRDDPARWLELLGDLENALTDYATVVREVRARAITNLQGADREDVRRT